MLSACAAAIQIARLIVNSKRIADPFESLAVDEHAIEAAVALRLASDVMPCGEDDAPALSGVDAGCGAAEITTRALAYLDENQGLPGVTSGRFRRRER